LLTWKQTLWTLPPPLTPHRCFSSLSYGLVFNLVGVKHSLHYTPASRRRSHFIHMKALVRQGA
jgi:hypothetical protein